MNLLFTLKSTPLKLTSFFNIIFLFFFILKKEYSRKVELLKSLKTLENLYVNLKVK